MRFSRPCYDKAHRCPGWIGGGLHWAKVERCKDGRITFKHGIGRCNRCDVIVLTHHRIRWLDPLVVQALDSVHCQEGLNLRHQARTS